MRKLGIFDMLFKTLSVFLVIVSCVKMVPENNKINKIYASVPTLDTKVNISGAFFSWNANDEISVFRSHTNERYRFEGETGESEGPFIKIDKSPSTPSFNNSYAVYPYKPTTVCESEGEMLFHVPEIQSYISGSETIMANIMVSKTDAKSEQYAFKNVCGYIELNILGGDVIKTITFKGNDNEKLSGDARISYSSSEPQLEVCNNSSNTIILDCGEEGVKTDLKHPTSFLIVIPPIAFEHGFTVTVETIAGTMYEKGVSRKISICRNEMKQMATIICDKDGGVISSFSLTDGTKTYPAFDISNDIISLYVNQDTDMKNLTAIFDFSGISIKVNGISQESGKNSHDFSSIINPICYSVTGKSGEIRTYKVYVYNTPTLVDNAGNPITEVSQWENFRRNEILHVFKDQEYGYFPPGDVDVEYKVLETSDDALEGKAIRKQVEITWKGSDTSRKGLLLLYLPKKNGKVPMFVCLNFKGNGTVSDDPAIINSQYNQAGRGSQKRRFPLDLIIDSGYGLATMHYFDCYYDSSSEDAFSKSIYPLFGITSKSQFGDNTSRAIGAWAWGYSQIVDYLCTDINVDVGKIISVGHSRLGKTSLWAGANDQRLSMVVSNDSGCSGAALTRRKQGETISAITSNFPHWFCTNYKQYVNKDESIPFDQHQLLALIAPRPLYVASASEDSHADPLGEFTSAMLVEDIYNLYGYQGLGTNLMPSVNITIGNRVGYHLRAGGHDIVEYDWAQFINFANRWLYKK